MELTMKTKFDYKGIRSEFPFLSRKVNKKPIIYLDSAASSQKPQNVIDQLVKTYSQSYSNIHRGLHTLSEEATNSYEEVRLKIARFINAYSKEEIIFTSGATMSINLIANSYGLSKLKPNDEIIITVAEHHANIIPWQMLCEKTGAKLIAVPVDKDGSFHISALKQRITKNTRIISVPHVSNVLGTVFPIKEISEIAHENKAICVVDGCQAGTHPIAECIALGAAVDFVTKIGMKNIENHEKSVLSYGHQRLASVKGLSFVGTSPNKSGVISFTLKSAHPHDISTLIDQDGVAIRAGHHCAQPLMKFLNLNSTARASVAIYTEPEDFDALAISLEKVNRIFGA